MIEQINFRLIYALLDYLSNKSEAIVNSEELKSLGIKAWQCGPLFNLLKELGCIEKFRKINQNSYLFKFIRKTFGIEDLIKAKNILIVPNSIENIIADGHKKIHFLTQRIEHLDAENQELKEENESLMKTRKTKAERIRDAMAN